MQQSSKCLEDDESRSATDEQNIPNPSVQQGGISVAVSVEAKQDDTV